MYQNDNLEHIARLADEPEEICSVSAEVLSEQKDSENIGIVVNCKRLNVREKPSVDSNVICVIDCQTELMIYEEESTDEFYKICTASGVEGFCMKKFIDIQP